MVYNKQCTFRSYELLLCRYHKLYNCCWSERNQSAWPLSKYRAGEWGLSQDKKIVIEVVAAKQQSSKAISHHATSKTSSEQHAICLPRLIKGSGSLGLQKMALQLKQDLFQSLTISYFGTQNILVLLQRFMTYTNIYENICFTIYAVVEKDSLKCGTKYSNSWFLTGSSFLYI